jgi:hypothetical protein
MNKRVFWVTRFFVTFWAMQKVKGLLFFRSSSKCNLPHYCSFLSSSPVSHPYSIKHPCRSPSVAIPTTTRLPSGHMQIQKSLSRCIARILFARIIGEEHATNFHIGYNNIIFEPDGVNWSSQFVFLQYLFTLRIPDLNHSAEPGRDNQIIPIC